MGELAAGGDLGNYVNKTHQNGTLIPIATKIMWLVQILDALNFMHRMGIAHLDLTPANVVFTGSSNMTAKVIDFGWSLPVNSKSQGNLDRDSLFCAPEQLEVNSRISEKTDVYVVGILAVYLILNRGGFFEQEMSKIFKNTHFRSKKYTCYN